MQSIFIDNADKVRFRELPSLPVSAREESQFKGKEKGQYFCPQSENRHIDVGVPEKLTPRGIKGRLKGGNGV